MLAIDRFDHIGIRISDPDISVPFYEKLGFEFITGAAFNEGHPIIMRHPSGLVFNLLGPANIGQGNNILMDRPEKYPGITHIAIKVPSIEDTRKVLADAGIAISDTRSFMGVDAIFIRDPDKNVVEIIGPGPDVAELIAEFETQQNDGAGNTA